MPRFTLLRLMFVLLVMFVFATADSSAQIDVPPSTLLWVRQFDSEDAPAEEQLTGISGENEIYVVGYTRYALRGQTDLDTNSTNDAFIRKHDIHGNEVWTRQFGSTYDDRAEGVATSPAGVYVVGNVTDAITPQAFVYKFDAEGNIQWMRQFGATGPVNATDVLVQDGAVYITGYSLGAIPGQSTLGSVDAYLRKYDFDGNEIWTRQFGTPEFETAAEIAGDGSHVYIVGLTNGNMADQINAGSADAFVTKFDSNGNQLWARQVGSALQDEGLSIAVNSTDVFVVGRTEGALPEQTQTGKYDSFIRRYDANGTHIWTRQFGTSLNDGAFNVTLNNGLVQVAGSAIFTPEAEATFNFDVYLHAFDTNGSYVWTQQFGSSEYDESNGILVIGSDVYIAGTTRSVLPDQLDMNNAGAYVRKYSFEGTQGWTQQFGAIQKMEAGAWETDLAVYEGIYVAGFTDATFSGQPHVGDRDGFIFKYSKGGQGEWVRQFGSQRGDSASGIAAGASGIYVGYNSSSAGAIDPLGYIRKYDVAGNEVWVRPYGLGVGDVVVNDSGLYVLGRRTMEVDTYLISRFDTDGNEIWSMQRTDTDRIRFLGEDDTGIYLLGHSSSSKTYYISKYLPDGTNDWTHLLNDLPLRCEYDDATVGPAGVFVFGSSCRRQYDLDGNVIRNDAELLTTSADYKVATDSLHIYQSWAEYKNVFVRKYDLEGNEIWTQKFSVQSDSHYLTDLAIDDESIYVLGRVSGTIGSQIQTGPFIAKLNKDPINYTDFLYLPIITDN